MKTLTLADDDGDRMIAQARTDVVVINVLDGEPVMLDWPAVNVLQAYLRRALLDAGCTIRNDLPS